MPPFGPIHRRKLIRELKKLGFSGPFAGGKHEFMIREVDQLRLFVLIHTKAKLADHCFGKFYMKLEFPGQNGNASNRIVPRIGKIYRPISKHVIL